MSTSADWHFERVHSNATISALPPSLRRELNRLRTTHLRSGVLAWLDEQVLEVTRARRTAVAIRRLTEPAHLEVLQVHRTAILLELSTSPAFLRRLHRHIDLSLRAAHLQKIDPSHLHSIPDYNDAAEPPRDGVWQPPSCTGLGVASFLDEPPDGFWTWVAAQAERERTRVGRPRSTYRVLVLDPRGGGFARALASRRPRGQFLVQEFGPELTSTTFVGEEPQLGQRRNGVRILGDRSAPVREQAYDLIVWSLPSPAIGGASNHHRIYGHPSFLVPEPAADPLPWLGSLGPRRWQLVMGAYVRFLVPGALRDGAMFIGRFPLGMRIHDRTDPSGQRNGYRGLPHLLDSLEDHFRAGNLDVEASLHQSEATPVPQPFAGTSRCPWQVYCLRKRESF
jgi:hypothetical protein